VRGAELVKGSPVLQGLSDSILYHHTHWTLLQDISVDATQKLLANCIYLADRVDVQCLTLRGGESNILVIKERIRQQIEELRGNWFAPELVDAFLAVSLSEAFWFALENEHVSGYVNTWLRSTQAVDMEFEDLRSLVRVFSCIVDAKSTFTREHSDGVASLARHIGELFALPERTCDMLELAGLLHDLGKLRVPDELLEKPGKFDELEYSAVQRHSFDTYNILKNIHGFEDIALWAGQHHERVNGSGYPYHLKSTQLSHEARIIAVADVFQALAQNRPYRKALPAEVIASILQEEVAHGKLDADVVRMVRDNLQTCWEAALAYNSLATPL
jgi:response regulator RpfG family c-di-GMP phosphodiesterase